MHDNTVHHFYERTSMQDQVSEWAARQDRVTVHSMLYWSMWYGLRQEMPGNADVSPRLTSHVAILFDTWLRSKGHNLNFATWEPKLMKCGEKKAPSNSQWYFQQTPFQHTVKRLGQTSTEHSTLSISWKIEGSAFSQGSSGMARRPAQYCRFKSVFLTRP